MIYLQNLNVFNSGFSFFPDKLLETLKDLPKRIVGIALMALGALAACYALYQCCACFEEFLDPPLPDDYDPLQPDPAANPFLTGKVYAYPASGGLAPYNHQILAIKPDEVEETSVDVTSAIGEKKAVKALTQKWLDDHQKEVKRLFDANVFPESIQSAISLPTNPYNSQLFSVMGRVLEIKNLYRHTHYVFTHGQASEISVINQIMKECVKTFMPRLHHPYKVPFRLPLTVTYSENANAFIDQYKANDNSSFFDDGAHSDKMLSVDAQFWNAESTESALDFFSTATNIIGSDLSSGALSNILHGMFMQFIPNHAVCSMLVKKAAKIAKDKRVETQVGVLYAICIPKAIVKDDKKNFAYPCHPFGKKCECFPGKDRIELLEAMQKNQHVFCRGGHFTQYRILTSRLTEEKDVRTFAVDALPKSKRKIYRDQIKELVNEVRLYSLLSDLIEKLETNPAIIDEINSLIEASPQLDKKYIQELFNTKGSDSRPKHHEDDFSEEEVDYES